ncbi:MAG: DNA polymerase III subunit beta [Candidatus Dasytiphilus stammeri]
MQLIIQREKLLKPLQNINRILTNKPLLPIINNVLMKITCNELLLTVTDLEMEISTKVILTKPYTIGSITVSAKKLLNICRYLPENSNINISSINQKIFIYSGSSKFYLSTLPASSFPNVEEWKTNIEFSIPSHVMRSLIEATHFSMSYQDVRYYLNGLLLETTANSLCAVATDGHRIAIYTIPITAILSKCSVILPRKCVIELLRLLKEHDTLLKIQIGSNNIRIHMNNYIFTSRLIEGKFPDYNQILHHNYDKIIIINREVLKKAFSRVSVLCDNKLNEVHLHIRKNELKITGSNLYHEQAEEILPISYEGADIQINLNINYVIEVLYVLKCDEIKLSLLNSISSVQIKDVTSDSAIYVIMPIKL